MPSRRFAAAGAVSSGADPGRAPNGARMGGATAQWSPTVANLMIILIVEMVAFAVIRYVFSRVA